jgi:hypothetical protein
MELLILMDIDIDIEEPYSSHTIFPCNEHLISS